MNKHLFIAGMQKCGTSALASWFIDQSLAEFLVPNEKEPNVYQSIDFGKSFFVRSESTSPNAWLLDASVHYSLNPFAISRMPNNCRIVLCFRNPWERTWSAYRMNKWLAMKLPSSRNDPNGITVNAVNNYEKELLFNRIYPSKLRNTISRYLEDESVRVREGEFSARLRYELDFFYARCNFPLRNCLGCTRYRFALGNILNKFAASDVFLVSLPKLKDAALRNRFVHELLGMKGDYPEIPPEFVLEGVDIGEEKPDFSRPEFDGLRSSFRYDLQEFEKLIEREGISTDYLDFDALWKNLR